MSMELSEFIQKFLAELGIKAGADVTPEDALELIRPIKEKLALEAVDDALAASMLFPGERQWATGYAKEHPISFRVFLEKRGPVRTTLSAHLRTAASARVQMTQADREMARKMGVSDELFLKYNAPSVPSPMTDIERQIARQVGMSDATFAKYNVAGR